MTAAEYSWIGRVRPREEPSARLCAFPHAGGRASDVRGWPDHLADELELMVAQLPGRPPRMAEPPVDNLATLAEIVAGRLYDREDLPLGLVGVSMGALLAFEVARRLEAGGVPLRCLVVVGRSGPSARPARASLRSGLGAVALDAEIRRLGGTPPEVLADRTLMRLLRPALRADLTACESHLHVGGAPLNCPIVAIAGLEDPFVDEAGLHAWAAETSAAFRLRRIPGGHLPTGDARRTMLRIVEDALLVKTPCP